MSLTLPSALRSAKDDDSIAGSAAYVPAVTQFGPEVTQAIADMLFGPTQYQGVCMLNRAADYMSDRCMAAATRNAEDFEHYFDAALFLRKHAEKLDQALVDELVADINAERA